MPSISRRKLLWTGVASLAALSGITGCRKQEFSCDGLTALSVDDIKLRQTLGYADRASDPAKACQRCQQFEPAPSGGQCGSCKMMKGPIHPLGTCKVYALKA